ncbi:acylphosphatase [Aquibacillus koreensis]|uniref:acylphosphatase n=1 Tax=Aquibacillus koreensis TaxID=279446 RepID=A0A9X3WS59_9BACI|nr:acylphosphatase [Aquibacillus koreensis]MCT2536088.1 acylphosphatase [Aquibacillus koreensis]MDC3422806.1 acylphosphatase [Aquibacillus koreensis]
MIRAHMIVHGRVQGVGFRASSKQLAEVNGVNGSVRNLEDGTVEIDVEGENKDVYQFIEQIKEGPSPFIKVNHVDIEVYQDLKGYNYFKISH